MIPCSMHSLEVPGRKASGTPIGIVSNKQSSGQCVSTDFFANIKPAQIQQFALATTMVDL